MKRLPVTDQRNWTRQAHPNNHCPHSNWWFLLWHRAYLYHFESICQDVLGDPTFRVPYWKWRRSRTFPRRLLTKTVRLLTAHASGHQQQSCSPIRCQDQFRCASVLTSRAVVETLIGNRFQMRRYDWSSVFAVPVQTLVGSHRRTAGKCKRLSASKPQASFRSSSCCYRSHRWP